MDITGRRIYARDWSGGPTASLATPSEVGSVALRTGGGLVAALRHAIAFGDVDRGTLEVVRELDTEIDGNRFNDGAVDPGGGGFWFGSMDMAESAPTGSFYRFGTDRSITRALDGIICSNGPTWSLDGQTIYHVDSTRRLIGAHDFD